MCTLQPFSSHVRFQVTNLDRLMNWCHFISTCLFTLELINWAAKTWRDDGTVSQVNPQANVSIQPPVWLLRVSLPGLQECVQDVHWYRSSCRLQWLMVLSNLSFYLETGPDVSSDFHHPSSLESLINQEVVKWQFWLIDMWLTSTLSHFPDNMTVNVTRYDSKGIYICIYIYIYIHMLKCHG